MGECTVGDPVSFVETRLGVHLRQVGSNEWAGPCPWCGGDDRFHVWDNGYFICRASPSHCSRKGWLDELEETKRRLSALELEVLAIKREQERNRREHEDYERRLSTLELMHQCKEHIHYHEQMDECDRGWWNEQGINDAMIDKYMLGVCYGCPTDHERRLSYTIPVINGGKLWNIRYRLIGGTPGDKYRPHMANLPVTVFNGDFVYKEDKSSIMICEGEKKSIVLDQYGFQAVGIMGKSGFKKPWAVKFAPFSEVMICLDPDATDRAHEMATWFGDRARVVRLPVKPDDFFTLHGGSEHDFEWFLRLARKRQ